MDKIVLNGITWGHSRGITPLLAASQRFGELYPNIEINWKKRTLQEFADYPIEKLVTAYDLLIIDHPWVGTAAATNCVLPVNDFLSKEFLNNQLEHSAGYSHESYFYAGKQWALAIDAATPAASCRLDLLEANNQRIPDTWEELIALAQLGKVIIPGIAVDLILNFCMFCLAAGEEPFRTDNKVVSIEKGKEALLYMKQLWSLCDKEVFNYNPIKVAEIMSSSDKYWYCPFAYCYSNYSRNGYAKNVLTYADLIRFKQHGRLKSTLGGTGLAVSAHTKNITASFAFAEWVTSATIQQTLYAEHGGQPGYRTAWTNEKLNYYFNNYFSNVLPALDRAYIRPRYHGFLHFQDKAGNVVRNYLMNDGNEEDALEQMNIIYTKSLGIRDGI